ncbi:MAG TPA: hypothetical protein VL994_12010 [Steroidobacteraceae bacterium]|nr:hypothetical protein [Steroidobacteraceae bacterium]
MKHTLAQVIADYRDFIALGLSSALLAAVLARYWDRVSLWWLNFLYGLPLVGKLRRLSRDISRSGNDEWTKSERTLCSDYKKHVRMVDRAQYLECKLYLAKAGDAGRSTFPLAIWVLIVSLVFVEAMGFSYVLAGWTVPGATENLQVTASYGIAFMLSVVLVALTHLSGHELHRSNAIRGARLEWREDPQGRTFASDEAHTLGETLADPRKSQSSDDGQPRYTQLANRVGTRPTYWMTILTGIFVVAVAVFATAVRDKTFQLQEIQETAGETKSYFGNTPPELATTQAAADERASQDGRATASTASLSTFVLLAVVFVFLQILGVAFGMRWGFAGRESHRAYRLSAGARFASFEEFQAYYYERVADEAQARLETLRQLMIHRNEHAGNRRLGFADKGFRDFVEDHYARIRSRAELSQVAPLPPVPRAAPATSVSVLPPPPPLRRYHFTDAANAPSTTAVTFAELEQLYAAGAITHSTWTLESGASSWVSYRELRQREADATRTVPG